MCVSRWIRGSPQSLPLCVGCEIPGAVNGQLLSSVAAERPSRPRLSSSGRRRLSRMLGESVECLDGPRNPILPPGVCRSRSRTAADESPPFRCQAQRRWQAVCVCPIQDKRTTTARGPVVWAHTHTYHFRVPPAPSEPQSTQLWRCKLWYRKRPKVRNSA